jgi:GT2 family glycosyltransferase
MMQAIKFTIIVPVIHSLEDLSRCLESLNQLDYPRDRFQIAIVDCRVVPGLAPFLDKYLPTMGCQARLLKLPDKPLRGPKWIVEQRLNEACNHAMKMMPAQVYIFTEDDCTLFPDWLKRYESGLTDEVGALGGPDILPHGLGWFPRALDYILNSFLGTAGSRGGQVSTSEHYYPRRQNMAIPAHLIERVGGFPGENLTGGELYLTNRIRTAGFKIQFLADNPVIHRRVTTYINFFRNNIYKASENVLSLRKQKIFFSSLHFLVFLSTLGVSLLVLLSFFSIYPLILLVIPFVMYIIILLISGIISTIRII